MSSRAAFSTRPEYTSDRERNAVWDRLRDLERALVDSPLFGGRLLTEEAGAVRGSGLAFTAGTPRSIPHGLGRRARGFAEVYGVDVQSAGHVGLYPTAHPAGFSSDSHVTVTPDASGTCFLWVF